MQGLVQENFHGTKSETIVGGTNNIAILGTSKALLAMNAVGLTLTVPVIGGLASVPIQAYDGGVSLAVSPLHANIARVVSAAISEARTSRSGMVGQWARSSLAGLGSGADVGGEDMWPLYGFASPWLPPSAPSIYRQCGRG